MSTSQRTETETDATPLAGAESISDADAERLSALLDGELDDETQTAAACARWRDHADARARWHSYGLIGDALRSDELAQASPRGDATFLSALRERLAHEPVPITRVTPERRVAAATVARRQLRRWTTPIGVAAGVLMVAGLAWTLRPDAGVSDLAATDATRTAPIDRRIDVAVAPAMTGATPEAPTAVTVANTTEPPSATGDGGELQPYLRVHRFYVGQPSAGPMPAMLRGASLQPGAR